MRVAHIITRMIIGGAQENTLYTCRDLIRDYGDDVLLITGPSLGPEGNLLEKSGIQNSEAQESRAGEPKIREVASLRRAIHPLHDWRALRAIRSILREYAPDVVHTHSAKAGILGRRAAWALDVPAVVHTVHGAPFHAYQSAPARWLYQTCERYAARRCHHIISVADAMTDLLVNAHVTTRDHCTTIYSGMDVEPFLHSEPHRDPVRARFGFQPEDVVFIKIARLFHLKGHADLIEAAAQVLPRHPRARFLLVGDGILRSELEADIRRRGLEHAFRFAGLIDPAEIPAHLAAADALVHTSYREGLARALPQALLSGHPAISYDIDGAREVVLDGETGFLIPPGDTTMLAARIGQLTEDATLRAEQGRAGREKFTDRFRHQTMTRQIRELYQKLIA